MKKIKIRDKHPGTSTLTVTLAICDLRSKKNWATLRFRIGLFPDADIVINIRHTDKDLDAIRMNQKYKKRTLHF
jgi:hypothetical protein